MANGIDILGVSETRFFSHVDGVLRQWLEVTLDSSRACRAAVSVTAGGERADTPLDLAPGSQTCRCYAPVRWPRPAVADAALRVEADGGLVAIVDDVTVGSHRPWTIYLLSDLCADDTWSYADLAQYDRDDYLTTLAELDAGPHNRYNFAAVYQTDRFFRQASRPEKARLIRALREGRFHATPVPDQLLCGAFVLSAYPALLEPYRRLCARVNRGGAPLSLDAYHMEATTWTNGLVNLLACAGFQSFTKSLLQYQAPWIFTLGALPRLMRLEVAPGRQVYFLLRCGDYMEGQPVLKDVAELSRFLSESVIPAHEALAGAYPLDAIPLVGAYGDLSPASKDHARVKVANVAAYNAQGWEYPRLVNATFAEFFDQVRAALGPPDGLPARALRAARGDTGSSWEVWPLAAQAEMAAFRRAQRDTASLRVLEAMRVASSPRRMKWLDACVAETVYLGDHAWNGDAGRDEVKALNLAVRRRRLARIDTLVRSLRGRRARVADGERLAVVNTLAWERTCRVRLPDGVAALRDRRAVETSAAEGGWAVVPRVPAFGARVLTAAAEVEALDDRPGLAGLGLSWAAMGPVCFQPDGAPADIAGGWNENLARGVWTAGPFRVSAGLRPWPDGGSELRLEVAGAPPRDAYELCWRIPLAWPECIWRGESGGGFVTPGPTEQGGDSLLGITGSAFSAGEGLSAAAGWLGPRVDFAFDESGVCGLGGRATALACGTYGERVEDDLIRRASMASCETPAVLLWYLLGNHQNHRETLLDQGGCRAWSFRCGIREVDRPFDDADLYRFAAGFNRPAELLAPGEIDSGRGAWLSAEPADAILLLGAARAKRGLEIDLYNTADRAVEVTLRGRAVRGKHLARADMLGQHPQPLRGGRFEAPPRAFVKVLAT